MHKSCMRALALATILFVTYGCAGEQRPAGRATARISLIAHLDGRSVPGQGDPDGSGSARVVLVYESNTICTLLETSNLSPIDLAHIHRGRAMETGPAVVSVDPPDRNPNDDCQLVSRTLLDEIRTSPEAFYVDVHSSEYPRGAVRGQLTRR